MLDESRYVFNMKRPSIPSHPSGGEDSWESLAEDLFGIDVGRTPESGEVVPPEELEPEELEEEEATPAAASEAASEAPSAAEAVSPDADTGQQAQPSGSAADRRAVELVESTAQVSTGDADSGEPPQRAADRRDDSYWDTLEELEKDETRGQEPSVGSRGPRTQTSEARSQTTLSDERAPTGPQSDRSAPAQRSRPEQKYFDNPEFGAGILDTPGDASEEQAAGTTPVETAEAAAAAAGDEGREASQVVPAESEADRSKRRRPRRRRRRPRSKDTELPDVAAREPGEQGAATAADDRTDDAARKPSERSSELPRQRSSGERRRPPAGATVKDESVDEEVETDDRDWDMDTDEDEDNSEESSRSSKSAYRKVPTWEEAISYLLNPPHAGPKGSESEAKASGPPKPQGSKPVGRRGRRRRR